MVDSLGRTDIGTFNYSPSGPAAVRPHAVASVTGTVNGLLNPNFGYDGNGNLNSVSSSSGSRTISWASFNAPLQISAASNGTTVASTFLYDADFNRVKRTTTKNGVQQGIVTYVKKSLGEGLLYEEEENSLTTLVVKKHYISVGGKTIGSLNWNGDVWSAQYWHSDHLNSPIAITDASGAVVERLAYEPFGKRRRSDGVTDSAGSLTSAITARGFSEHEMLDDFDFIHMNGRIYDSTLGRFISPDPLAKDALSQVGLNSYAYANNNPQKFVDPTGYQSELPEVTVYFTWMPLQPSLTGR